MTAFRDPAYRWTNPEDFSGTSSNSNNVATLDATAAPDYDPSQMQDLFNKLDELINALRRV